jgi:hypothetical protein
VSHHLRRALQCAKATQCAQQRHTLQRRGALADSRGDGLLARCSGSGHSDALRALRSGDMARGRGVGIPVQWQLLFRFFDPSFMPLMLGVAAGGRQ